MVYLLSVNSNAFANDSRITSCLSEVNPEKIEGAPCKECERVRLANLYDSQA